MQSLPTPAWPIFPGIRKQALTRTSNLYEETLGTGGRVKLLPSASAKVNRLLSHERTGLPATGQSMEPVQCDRMEAGTSSGWHWKQQRKSTGMWAASCARTDVFMYQGQAVGYVTKCRCFVVPQEGSCVVHTWEVFCGTMDELPCS
ncbi:hypothetical protein NDU88_001577 [Pleurodeles waltl]|uniref:Uncharacterized protein n=1 Tax=Pleurodeles waltl TaxID=8319 RepID=A0AAV7T0A5_PLEWA|nr:hypothetical protein NDU88_001577 [Pleurodeles waltl]